MEYAYAALLLAESGEELNEANLTAVLEAAGVAVVESRVKALVAALEGVDVGEIGPDDAADIGDVGEPARSADGDAALPKADAEPPMAGDAEDGDAGEGETPSEESPDGG